MAWVSSTFGNNVGRKLKDNKRAKSNDAKPSKKMCLSPWVDEYPPTSSEDLAIHKKKLQDVQNWLTESTIPSNGKRMLLLTGPPGSSKSAVIRTLAKEMKFSLREWVNSFISSRGTYNEDFNSYYRDYDIEFPMNQSDKFSEFIFKSSKYKDICGNNNETSSLILVEELPNVFTMRPLEFHQILKKYSTCCKSPLVFIISEGNKNSIVKSLFPIELQDELLITNIAFNPVSSSLLQNALSRILNLTGNATSSYFDSVGSNKKQFLQMVAEKSEGDVRSAINTLQFVMMKGETDDDRIKKTTKGVKAKKASSNDLIGCKDSSLILFRALGKVLYCKREKSVNVSCCKPLPAHLRVHERDSLLENPDDIFERSGSTSSSFCLFLHQNCLPFFSDISDFSAAVNYLSDADILDATWDPSNALEAYGSTVSIRGMMHSLKGNSKGAPYVFRSLTKPSWYNYVNTSKDRLERIKYLNRYLPIGNEELTSVYLPLLSKISYGSHTEADRFIKEVGLMYPPPAGKGGVRSVEDVAEESFVAPAEEEDEEFFIEEIED